MKNKKIKVFFTNVNHPTPLQDFFKTSMRHVLQQRVGAFSIKELVVDGNFDGVNFLSTNKIFAGKKIYIFSK